MPPPLLVYACAALSVSLGFMFSLDAFIQLALHDDQFGELCPSTTNSTNILVIRPTGVAPSNASASVPPPKDYRSTVSVASSFSSVSSLLLLPADQAIALNLCASQAKVFNIILAALFIGGAGGYMLFGTALDLVGARVVCVAAHVLLGVSFLLWAWADSLHFNAFALAALIYSMGAAGLIVACLWLTAVSETCTDKLSWMLGLTSLLELSSAYCVFSWCFFF